MRRTVVALGAALAIVAGSAPAGAAVTVRVRDSSFGPDVVRIAARQRVTWDWVAGLGGSHNVREDDRLFRSGAPTASGSATFSRIFSAGTFHYYCEVHGSASGGMDAVVRVRPVLQAAPTGRPFTVIWAATSFQTGSTFDVQFRVGSGSWRSWRRNTPSVSAIFGRDGKPVTLRAGKRYSFRARSQQGGDDTTASRWSPVVSWTV